VTLRPEDCIIVEDSPTVVRSVKRAGFHVLAVTTSIPASYFDDADWIAPSLRAEDLKKVLPDLAFE
jgi:beta-phosphoglucomutase-like phosphatase (HAD superfamily)